MRRPLSLGLAFALCLVSTEAAVADYGIVSRSVAKEGKERYPAGAPGIDANNRAPYSLNPGADFIPNGDLIIAGSRMLGHDTAGTVGSIMRSKDRGRTWNRIQDEEIVFNPDPAKRCMLETIRTLKTGAHAGRIVVTAFTDALAGSVVPYLLYNDDPGAAPGSWSAPIPLPLPESTAFARYARPFEVRGHAGRVYLPGYFYRNNSWKVSVLYYSDDPTLQSWTLLSTIADAGNGSERKEPFVDQLDDDRLLALIRSDDTTQVTYKKYSSDGGATWGSEAVAFNGWNQPEWIQARNGDLICTSRTQTIGQVGGNDSAYSMFTVSSDRGATWTTPVSLNDPTIDSGVGGASGGAVVQLAGNRIGIVSANARVGQVFNVARLEFIEIDPAPASSGEYALYSLDPVYGSKHPSAYVAGLFAWYHIEQLRRDYALGASVTRWKNGLGLPSRDLVWSGQESAAVFADESSFSTGLVGGRGAAQGGNFQFATATSIAQPVAITMVVDAQSTGSLTFLIDDGSGTQLRWSGSAFVSAMSGSTSITWSGSWSNGPHVITYLLDGANTTLRVDGVARTVSSGGPMGASALTTLRLNGPGNAGFIGNFREVEAAQTRDLTTIGMLENAWCVKHLGKQTDCTN